MAKVTSKLQVTVPKAIADRYGIRPGDDIEWVAAGDAIRVEPARKQRTGDDLELRLRLFDAATERVSQHPAPEALPASRGWTREDLYQRGRSR